MERVEGGGKVSVETSRTRDKDRKWWARVTVKYTCSVRTEMKSDNNAC